MNEKFQQAVVASRAGQDKAAQYLLTQSLQEDPNDPNAWFLLSQLVDSEEKKQVYLAKVIALDPDHELAKEYYTGADVKTAVSPPDALVSDVVQESDDLMLELDDMAALEAALDAPVDDLALELDDSDEEMDDWLRAAVEADSDPSASVDEIDFAELLEEDAGEEIEETAVVDPITPIEEKEAGQVEAVEKKETAVVDGKKEKRQKDAKNLGYAIYLLVAIAVIIFFYMAYLLLA